MMTVRLTGCASALMLLLANNAAQADVILSADVGLRGGLSSNPYGRGGSNTSSGTVSGDFSPTATINSPTGNTRVYGRIARIEYFERYGGTTDYGGGVSTQHQLSPVTSINGSFSYSSSVRNGLNPVIDPSIPIDPNLPPVVDPTAATGYAQRTETFSAGAGLSTSLSARDSVSFSARGSRIAFPRGSGATFTYNSYGGSTSYSRAIGATTSIGVSFDLGRIDYAGAGNDSTQYSPAATFSTSFSERLTFNASAGVSITHFNQIGLGNKTSFSGSGVLCYVGDLSRFCLNGARRVGGTSLAGTSTVTSFGANYSLALDPSSNISAGVSYSKSQALIGQTGQDTNYIYSNVSYSRQILERLSAVVAVVYSDSANSLVNPRANFAGSVGLKYRLGSLR